MPEHYSVVCWGSLCWKPELVSQKRFFHHRAAVPAVWRRKPEFGARRISRVRVGGDIICVEGNIRRAEGVSEPGQNYQRVDAVSSEVQVHKSHFLPNELKRQWEINQRAADHTKGSTAKGVDDSVWKIRGTEFRVQAIEFVIQWRKWGCFAFGLQDIRSPSVLP